MNAEKAREISMENANLVAEKELKEAIEEMKKQIQSSATDGYYEASISVAVKGPWNEYNNSRRLKEYFYKLGYGMEVVDYTRSTTFRAFW